MSDSTSFSRPRLAIMVVFAAFGTAVGAVAGSMPVLTRNAAVANADLGLAISLSTLATVVAMSSGGLLARRFNNRQVLLWGLPVFALCDVLLLFSSSPAHFFAGYIIMGCAIGFVDVFMNAEGTAIERDIRTPIFSAFHGCVSASVVVFAILASYLSVNGGLWLIALAVAVSFTIAWLMVWRIIVPRPLAMRPSPADAAVTDRRPLVMLGMAAGLILAGELAALMWSAQLLAEQAPELAAVAGLGAAFFGLCNAVIRFPGDYLRHALGDLPLMMGSLLVAIFGFTLLGLSQNFALSVAGFAAVGLGTAVLMPCVLALAAGFAPGNQAAGIGFVSMIAGAPRTLAPWVFGWIAEVFGLGVAFGLLAFVLTVALVLVASIRRAA